jgi:hypothetical protein
MTIQGFTAEVSLGKTRESYILTSETPAETGRVLPQRLCHCVSYYGVPLCTCIGGYKEPQ